jgi:methionyl aminopeptidase
MVSYKSQREIDLMRQAADILKEVLCKLGKLIKPGINTIEIDKEAEKLIKLSGATPAFLGYHGFPSSVCASINDEVVHGIPNERILKDGDIVSIDAGVIYKGFFSDAARTWPVGRVTEDIEKLIKTTRQSLYEGLKTIKKGSRLGDLSNRIQTYAESFGYSVVRDFVGHGIGRELHEDPQVPNFGQAGTGMKIEPGLVIAIEPMVNMGSSAVKIMNDGWTVVTQDGKLSAHHEETIVVTEDGYEVLTRFEEN